MIDNVNGFVPNSHSNGKESSDSGDPWASEGDLQAHYSPVSGLTGGPERAEMPTAEPEAGQPAQADLVAQDTVATRQPETERAASELEPEFEGATNPVLDAGPSIDEEPSTEAIVAVEPTAEPAEPEMSVVEQPAPGDTELQPDASATTDEVVDDGVAADEPDPNQPLPVGRPPSPLELDAQVESLLFVADGPAPIGKLAEALEVRPAEVEAALEALEARYLGRGIAIQRIKDRVQLTTAPTAAGLIQRFLGLSATAPLSKAALETLAIIAYRQPITRPQIEQLRGVNSDSVIKNLLTKGLVEEAGIADGPGRPVLYVTTPEFLQHFGLSALSELPALNLDDARRNFASEILKG